MFVWYCRLCCVRGVSWLLVWVSVCGLVIFVVTWDGVSRCGFGCCLFCLGLMCICGNGGLFWFV